MKQFELHIMKQKQALIYAVSTEQPSCQMANKILNFWPSQDGLNKFFS